MSLACEVSLTFCSSREFVLCILQVGRWGHRTEWPCRPRAPRSHGEGWFAFRACLKVFFSQQMQFMKTRKSSLMTFLFVTMAFLGAHGGVHLTVASTREFLWMPMLTERCLWPCAIVGAVPMHVFVSFPCNRMRRDTLLASSTTAPCSSVPSRPRCSATTASDRTTRCRRAAQREYREGAALLSDNQCSFSRELREDIPRVI